MKSTDGTDVYDGPDDEYSTSLNDSWTEFRFDRSRSDNFYYANGTLLGAYANTDDTLDPQLLVIDIVPLVSPGSVMPVGDEA